MPVQYLDPRGLRRGGDEPYALRADLRSGGIGVGLLANNFTDAGRFLDHIEETLHRLVPNLTVRRYANPSITPAPADLRLQIGRECGAVIAAYGH